MKEILKRLCAPVCVSGDEMTLSKMIYDEVSPYCDSAKIDKAGNVICTKKGKTAPKSKIMLAAHLDEVGFIITNITLESQYPNVQLESPETWLAFLRRIHHKYELNKQFEELPDDPEFDPDSIFGNKGGS